MGNESINKTLVLLTAILEVAGEYGYLSANPAKGRRRRLKTSTPTRTYLQPEQVRALLAAAGTIDAERAAVEPRDTGWRKPLLAVLCLSGVRIGEALGLRWRNVDLMGARLEVVESKTDAGVRQVDLTPYLRELIAEYRARARYGEPDDFVFATRTGKRQNQSNIRNRLLASEAPKGYSATAVERADAMLLRDGGQPLPHTTPHSLRRTYVSIMAMTGAPGSYVMDQAGHTSERMTFSVYRQAIRTGRDHGAELDELIGEKASFGQNEPVDSLAA